MSLRQSIVTAFAQVPQPGEGNITRCPYHCRECARILQFFKGKTWQQHTSEELRLHHNALSLFTPEAFHYFLPAFMLASLDADDQVSIITDSIRFHFEFNHEQKEYFQVRLSKLTTEQRKVIVEFLKQMEHAGAGPSEHAIRILSEEWPGA